MQHFSAWRISLSRLNTGLIFSGENKNRRGTVDRGDLNGGYLSHPALSAALGRYHESGPFLPHSSLFMAGPLASQQLAALVEVSSSCGEHRVTDTGQSHKMWGLWGTCVRKPCLWMDLTVSEWDTWYLNEDIFINQKELLWLEISRVTNFCSRRVEYVLFFSLSFWWKFLKTEYLADTSHWKHWKWWKDIFPLESISEKKEWKI